MYFCAAQKLTFTMSPLLGAHMSVAGGLPLSVDRAVLHGCDAFQIFAKNANRWRGRILPAEEIREFRARVKASGIGPVVSHASYLITLATTNEALRRQSVEAMGDEIDRAEALGLLGVVLHPGCYTDGNEADAPRVIADALLQVLSDRRRGRTMVLLEQTAGQGTSIGARFEHLASILAHAKDHGRLGVCLDTCHLLAAGYDVGNGRYASHTGARVLRVRCRAFGERRRFAPLADLVRKSVGLPKDVVATVGRGVVEERLRKLANRLSRDGETADIDVDRLLAILRRSPKTCST